MRCQAVQCEFSGKWTNIGKRGGGCYFFFVMMEEKCVVSVWLVVGVRKFTLPPLLSFLFFSCLSSFFLFFSSFLCTLRLCRYAWSEERGCCCGGIVVLWCDSSSCSSSYIRRVILLHMFSHLMLNSSSFIPPGPSNYSST